LSEDADNKEVETWRSADKALRLGGVPGLRRSRAAVLGKHEN